MSIKSSGGLITNPSIATPNAPPAVFGMWLKYVDNASGAPAFSWCDSTLSTDGFCIYFSTKSGISRVFIDAFQGSVNVITGGSTYVLTSTYTSDTWVFVVFRISSTNCFFMDILYENGVIEQVGLPPGFWAPNNPLVTFEFFASSFFSLSILGVTGVSIAEFWACSGDILGDPSAQADTTFIRKLASHGPTYFPHVYKNLVDYKELRNWNGLLSNGGSFNKSTRWGRSGVVQQQNYVYDTSRGTIGSDRHPPLPYTLERPSGFTLQPGMI